MTKDKYERFKLSFSTFMKKEAIENLTAGNPWCSQCSGEWGEDNRCVDCGMQREYDDEPFVSSHGCECCGSPYQQLLYNASGYNRELDKVFTYWICSDCVLYSEYGELTLEDD